MLPLACAPREQGAPSVDLLAAATKDCPAGRLLVLDAVVRDTNVAQAICNSDEALREVLLHYLRCRPRETLRRARIRGGLLIRRPR